MSDTPRKTTIDLPFSPEDVRNGTVRSKIKQEAYDAAWQRVLSAPELAAMRAKVSIEDMRKLIAVVMGD